MEKIAVGMGMIILASVSVFLMVSLAPLLGAFSGWIVSIIFPNWVSGGFAAFGLHIDPSDFYKIGAMLGWVGAFFKFSANKTMKKD